MNLMSMVTAGRTSSWFWGGESRQLHCQVLASIIP